MRCTKIAIAIGIVSPLFAQFQNRPPVLQLTLKQAVEIAVAPEGSTRVKLAEESLKQQAARADQPRAALLPHCEGYIQDQNETNTLKPFGFQFPNVPIPGFTIPPFVGPFNVV